MYHCAQMLDYNVPGGKLNRGMAVADILRVFKKGEVGPCSTRTLCNPVMPSAQVGVSATQSPSKADQIVQVTEEELFRANALGWCIEWVRTP